MVEGLYFGWPGTCTDAVGAAGATGMTEQRLLPIGRAFLCLYLLLQAAQLLCSFREYHRRASFGLCAYYGQKLAAYEDALLNVREALFTVHQDPEQQDQQQQEDQLLKVSTAGYSTSKNQIG